MPKLLKFYAVVDDLIGGYAISLFNKPTSEHAEDEHQIGNFITREWAIRVAVALNTVGDPDYATAADRAHAVLGLGPGIIISAAAIEGIVDGALRK